MCSVGARKNLLDGGHLKFEVAWPATLGLVLPVVGLIVRQIVYRRGNWPLFKCSILIKLSIALGNTSGSPMRYQ
jgi:hypothetical protein